MYPELAFSDCYCHLTHILSLPLQKKSTQAPIFRFLFECFPFLGLFLQPLRGGTCADDFSDIFMSRPLYHIRPLYTRCQFFTAVHLQSKLSQQHNAKMSIEQFRDTVRNCLIVTELTPFILNKSTSKIEIGCLEMVDGEKQQMVSVEWKLKK